MMALATMKALADAPIYALADVPLVFTLGQTKLASNGFSRPKAIAFLSYLLLEGDQSRQKLADLFWGDKPKQMMGSLRNLMFQLKNVVALDVGQNLIGFAGVCDVQLLQQYLEQGDDAAAIGLYRGEFLLGFEPPANSPLAEWLQTTRQFIKRQILEAHLRLYKSGQGLGLDQPRALLDDSLRDWFEAELKQLEQTVSNNLPSASSVFFGRKTEIALVLERLGRAQMVNLLGLGGIGKTRLALEVAQAALMQGMFSGGVFWVGLESAQRENELLWRVAVALGLQPSPEPLLGQIAEFVGHKPMLLVLDNCEQLVAQADVFAALLEVAPNLRLLCTSREVLGLQAEHVYPLSGLELADAEALFLARANLPSSTAVIAQICQVLFGIPLAIELAVPQLVLQSAEGLLEQIKTSLVALNTQSPELPPRQRSLQAVFLHSWMLLSLHERHAMLRMALFRGGASRSALGQVAEVSLSVLAKLIDASLVQRQAERYTIHPLILEFVLELSEHHQNFSSWQQQHGEFFLTMTAKYLEQIRTPQASQAMRRIEQDYDNLKVAWRWMLEQKFFKFIVSLEDLVVFFDRKGMWQEGVEFFLQGISATPKDADAKAILLVGAAWLCHRLQRSLSAIDYAEQVLQLQTQVIMRSKALNILASVNVRLERYDQAIVQYQQILQLPIPTERRITILVNLAQIYFDELQADKAQTTLQEAKTLLSALHGNLLELQIAINLCEASFFDRANDQAPPDFVQNFFEVYQHSKTDYQGTEIYFELYLATFYWRSGQTKEFLYFINLFFLHSNERRVLPLIAVAYLLVGQYLANSAPEQSRPVLGQALQLAYNLKQIAIFIRVAIFYVVHFQPVLPVQVFRGLENRATFLWQKKQLATVQVMGSAKKHKSANNSDAFGFAQVWLLNHAKKSGSPSVERAIPNIFWVSEGN